MSKPLVSVIIPAYNAALLVEETVLSILNQTYFPLEIIVVDDGSKDNTQEVLNKYIKENKVRYIRQDNQGQAAARKNGFEASKGDYISFIDADDLIAPEKIALQIEYMQAHSDCGVCYSDIAHFWHHEPKKLLHKKLYYYEGYIFDRLIRENFIQVMTALIRRDVLEKFGVPGPKFRRSDDWYLWLNLAHHNVKFCFMDKVLSFQRRQKQGTLSDQKTYFKETAETNIAIYEEFKQKLSEEEKKKYDIDSLLNFWQFRRAVGYTILGDRESAKKALSLFKIKSFGDFVKKIALMKLLFFFGAKIAGRIIFAIREWRRHESFELLNNESVSLPKVIS